jgi:hypothetical protein
MLLEFLGVELCDQLSGLGLACVFEARFGFQMGSNDGELVSPFLETSVDINLIGLLALII